MSDENFDKTIDHEPAEPARRGWSRGWIVGALAVAAVGGLGVVGALSSDFGPGRMIGGAEHAGWGGPGGHHGPRGGMGFGMRGMDRVLDEVDATDEQKDRIRTIMRETRNEVEPLFDAFRDSRGDLVTILSGATVDRAAADKLRTDRLADIDQASQKLTAAMLDAAEVLTPEQRAELRDHLEDRRGWRR